MVHGDGRGERGRNLSPLYAEDGSSKDERPPVATGSAESSLHGEDRQRALHLSTAEASKAFLIGLGLWPLPGGFWVVLFVPWELLATQLGGGR